VCRRLVIASDTQPIRSRNSDKSNWADIAAPGLSTTLGYFVRVEKNSKWLCIDCPA
jgi:hypothetical protein